MKNIFATLIVVAATCSACVMNWNPDQLSDSTTHDTPAEDFSFDDVGFDIDDLGVDTVDVPVDSTSEDSLADTQEDEIAEDTATEVLDTPVDDGWSDVLDTFDTLEDTHIDTVDTYDSIEDPIIDDLFDVPDDSSFDLDVIDWDTTEDIAVEDFWDTISEDTLVDDVSAEDTWDATSEDSIGDVIIDLTEEDSSTITCTGGNLSGVKQVSGGMSHTCVLMNATGGVMCWGYNANGELGDSTNTGKTRPVDVWGLSVGVDYLRVGHMHSCVLMQTGGVKCWGYGIYGEIGDGTFTSKNVPTDVVGLGSGIASIGLGAYLTCAVTDAGELKCWGINDFCQVGDGSTVNKNIPVDITSISLPVRMATPGRADSCVLLENGTVKCWGRNDGGQLGNGTTTGSCTPVDAMGLVNTSTMACQQYHLCAVDDVGTLKCWGWNAYGQLGDGTIARKTIPNTVAGLPSTVDMVATGWAHTCALLSNDQVWCWGRNTEGQLGDGTYNESHVPVQVIGLSSTPVQIACGSSHACATLDNGQVQCWGQNNYGQLGDGSSVISNTPVHVICE